MEPRKTRRSKKRGEGIISLPSTGTALVPANPPQRTGIISTIAKSLEGGKIEFMELARHAAEIDVKVAPIIEGWDSLSEEAKRRLDLDSLCKELKMDPFHFLAVVAESAMKYRDNASIIMAAISLPSVVQKSIDVALTDAGISDRKMLMQHSAFLPMPKGSTIVNTFAANLQNNNEVNQHSSALPSFEKTMDIIESEEV